MTDKPNTPGGRRITTEDGEVIEVGPLEDPIELLFELAIQGHIANTPELALTVDDVLAGKLPGMDDDA